MRIGFVWDGRRRSADSAPPRPTRPHACAPQAHARRVAVGSSSDQSHKARSHSTARNGGYPAGLRPRLVRRSSDPPACQKFRLGPTSTSGPNQKLFLAKGGDGSLQRNHIGEPQRCSSGGKPTKLLSQRRDALAMTIGDPRCAGKLGRDQGNHDEAIARLYPADQDRVRARLKRSTTAGTRMTYLTKGRRRGTA